MDASQLVHPLTYQEQMVCFLLEVKAPMNIYVQHLCIHKLSFPAVSS